MNNYKGDYKIFYPSYWLYNAGLVGIVRTIETAKNEEKNKDSNVIRMENILKDLKLSDPYYKFGENGELLIHNKVWNILPDLYVWMMNKYNIIWFASLNQKGKIFSGNYLFNSMESKIKKALEIIEKYRGSKDEDIFLKSFLTDDLSLVKHKIKGLLPYKLLKDNPNNLVVKAIIKSVLQNSCIDFLKSLYEDLKRYTKNDKNDGKWMTVIKKEKNIKTIYFIFSGLLRHLFYELKDSNENTYSCSFCNLKYQPWEYEEFNTIWFSLEGGSINKFSNSFWYGKSQINICPICQFVLLFTYIGLNGNLKNAEFINITDAEQLWILNEYLRKLNEKEKQKSEKDKRSRLIDAITSTGVILKIKSRWVLQNIDFIEISGARDKTVYNFDIAPESLSLLTDYSAGLIPVWLSDIEKIYISNKKYPKVIGKKLIQSFLRSEINILINNAIVVFKYIWKENFKNKNFQDNIYPKFYQLKNFLLIILSLVYKFQSTEEFYIEGRNFKLLLINKNNERNIEMFINKIFPKIITNRKEEFVNDILRIYMSYQQPIPKIISNFLSMNNEEFKTQSLLFLTGVLE